MKRARWKLRRIDELGDVIGGRQRSPHHTQGTRRPYLRVANVFDGYIDGADVNQMPFTDTEFATYQLVVGDVLLNEGQSLELVGRAAMYRGAPPQCAFQNTLVRVRPNSDTDPQFLEYLLRNLYWAKAFSRIASRTTSIAHLGVSRLAGIQVRVPDRATQIAIAHAIAPFIAHSQALEQLLAEQAKLKSGLTQDLLSGRRRFSEFEGSAWREVRIGEHSRAIIRRSDGNELIPVLSITKHRGLVPSLEYFGRRVYSKDLSGYRIIRRSEFAYATNHINEGSIGLLHSLEVGQVSPMYTVFAATDDVDPLYLIAVLKTETLRQRFASRTSASVDRRGGLRWSEFAKIRIPLPSLPEQRRIAAVLGSLDRHFEVLTRLRQALRDQKRALMDRLLSEPSESSR